MFQIFKVKIQRIPIALIRILKIQHLLIMMTFFFMPIIIKSNFLNFDLALSFLLDDFSTKRRFSLNGEFLLVFR